MRATQGLEEQVVSEWQAFWKGLSRDERDKYLTKHKSPRVWTEAILYFEGLWDMTPEELAQDAQESAEIFQKKRKA